MVISSLLLLLLASCFLMGYSFQEKEVCIIPSENREPYVPLYCDSAQVFNITQYCQGTGSYSDTVVRFLGGLHTLNNTCRIRDAKNLTFQGENGSKVVIKCSDNEESGFIFFEALMLEISGIEFANCGSSYNITFNFEHGSKEIITSYVFSTLLFINGSGLTLRSVTVSDAKSAGIYIYNVIGNVTIDSCNVTNASSYQLVPMSGNIIAYDNLTNVITNLQIVSSVVNNSGYINSTRNCSGYRSKEVSYSSGLTLLLGSPKLTVNIINTNFSNNSGCNGGNMALLFFNYSEVSQDAIVTVTKSTFFNGSAVSGGGLYAAFENYLPEHKNNACPRHTDYPRLLSVLHSTFKNNFGKQNGGGFYMDWKQLLLLDCVFDMDITNSTFDNNSIGVNGSGGLAVDYRVYTDTGNDPHKLAKFRINLNITDCLFVNHNPNTSDTSEQLLSESSVIFTKWVPYLGMNGVNVTKNSCTGILAIASTLVFMGESTISDNMALSGAGIRLCSSAIMYLTPHTKLLITKNSVQKTGGGISVNTNCLVNVPMCFYQYTKEITLLNHFALLDTINVTISHNKATEGGDNIFGGSVDYCYFLYVNKRLNKHFNYKQLLHVPKNTNSLSSISSNPQHVCFIGETVGDDDWICDKNRNATIYPGESVNYPIRVVGQAKGAVPGTVSASPKDGAVIEPSEQVQTVDIHGQTLGYNVYSSTAAIPENSGQSLSLTVDMESDTGVRENFRRYLPAVISIQFKPCPFGFINSNENNRNSMFSCQCDKRKFIEKCSIEQGTITKEHNSWVGMFELNDNHSYLSATRYCPLDYCDPNFRDIKSEPNYLQQDEQCQHNRTGILCGSCPRNWSLILGTSECREKCSNLWLLLIIPFALAGLLLVAIIHYLNLTVTMGTICGVIFYANIMQDYSIAMLSEHPIPVVTPVLRVFLAWLNLDLGIPTCFYDGMQAFGKTMLLSVFPIYIWLISAVIIILSNRYIFVTQLIGENAVKVLATLLLLSYSKMLRVTIGTLNFKILHIYIGNQTTHRIRWILDGNISYFDPQKHLSMLIICILFILLSFLLCFSLLCIRHIYSLSTCCKVFSRIDKLKPFLDTYTGPFKDRARFWTGLLLLVRLVLLLVHIFDFNSDSFSFLVVVAVCFILSTIMVFLKGVYKSHYLNMLEHFFIFNIGIAFLTQLHSGNQWTAIISHILVGSAFLIFLGILAYHTYLKFSDCKWLRRQAFLRRNVDFDVRSCEGMRGYDRIEDTTDNEDMADASSKMHHFPPLMNHGVNYERSKSFTRN